MLLRYLQQRSGIETELDPLDRLQRRRDLPLQIGQREPDRLGAEVEAEQARMRRKVEKGFERNDLAGHGKAVSRAAPPREQYLLRYTRRMAASRQL